jgi:hypothetical protein
MADSTFKITQDPPSQRQFPFSIRTYPTPGAPDPMNPVAFDQGGMFPDNHYPIEPIYHKPSPTESSAVDPYHQPALDVDFMLNGGARSDNQPYFYKNEAQNMTYKMEPLNANGNNARGGRFAMDYDELEKYRKREYTVEQPTVRRPYMQWADTENPFYPYPGFFLTGSSDYLTYPIEPNYLGTAPVTKIDFNPVRMNRFYSSEVQKEAAPIETLFSSTQPPVPTQDLIEDFGNMETPYRYILLGLILLIGCCLFGFMKCC